ncbi:GyrI-like domain-containing protein [Neobacillus niacini]|uniref:GyrI-like domain-containing protein n=1 Tax=Neobacillus niacini TaxID=86668 RepID=UPI002FFFACAF
MQKGKKDFNVIGMKNSGVFANFGSEVPKFARQLLSRVNEIQNRSKTEIALYDPKRVEIHLEGHYYVGLIVNDTLNEAPSGMEYIEATQDYVTTKGKISDLGDLHLQLLKLADEQGYQRNLEAYIVETYHPIENGEEEVEIYLPIHS